MFMPVVCGAQALQHFGQSELLATKSPHEAPAADLTAILQAT